jgi:hypothetical protein
VTPLRGECFAFKNLFSTIPTFTPASSQPEYWNNGMMGSWIGITLKEVGGASACGGLEAEGHEFFASSLSEAILKRSAPEPKGRLSQLLIPNIPTFHRSIWFNARSELLFRIPRYLNFGHGLWRWRHLHGMDFAGLASSYALT